MEKPTTAEESATHVPSVSVIIPAFNAARFISATVASVAQQRLEGIEVVIVNDGSSDETRDVVQHIAAGYRGRLDIRFGSNERNQGGGATRNACLRLARGEYIFNLDADNLLTPGLLTRLLEAAEGTQRAEGRHAMISPAAIQYFRDVPRCLFGIRVPGLDRRVMMHRWEYADLDYEFVMTQPVTPASSGNYLFHRSIAEHVGGYFEDCGAYDAWSFGLRCYYAGYRYIVVPGTEYLHRLHGESYWVRSQQSGEAREGLMNTVNHFAGVYTARTLTSLEPSNPTYPDDPFAVMELATAASPVER